MLVNSDQIQFIEAIPESKLVMMNGEYLLAKENMDTILERVIEYKHRCFLLNKEAIKELLQRSELENI